MRNLNIALFQNDIYWESCDKNLTILDQKLLHIEEAIDLIILPEMFTAGFSMYAKKISQNMNGKIVKWLVARAKEKEASIIGSVTILDRNKYYNRLLYVQPNGRLTFYDKKHLFRFVGEGHFYNSGSKRIIVDCCGWKIALFICYDLRFPVWIRNIDNEYDVAIFVANWPALRANAWKYLLIARAIENQSYVIGANRIGKDGNEIDYRGDSLFISPNGNLIINPSVEESILKGKLIYNELKETRFEFPVWKDADKYLIKYR